MTTDETNAVLNKPLKRICSCDLYWIDDDGEKQCGHHADLRGDCSNLRGDCSDLRGDCSGLLRGDCSSLWGDCSSLQGDCSDLQGDCSKIPFHVRPCNLSDWIEE